MHLKHSLWLKCVTFTTVLNQQCLETMTTIKECVQPSLKLCSVFAIISLSIPLQADLSFICAVSKLFGLF